MALADIRATLGVPPQWADDMWPAFERMVLDVLCRALQQMKSAGLYRLTWKENKFSAELLSFVDNIRLQERLPFYPHDECRLLEPLEDPDKAPRIDFAIRHHSMERSAYFGVEAKVVTLRTVELRTKKDSITKYVHEGLLRFVTGQYAPDATSVAMLGYILAGSPKIVAKEVNNILKEERVAGSILKRSKEKVAKGIARYRSSHTRTNSTVVQVHHLMCVLGRAA